jgi:anti-sigma28 factor (negative regulator of flagellin synthesis)
MPVTPKKKTTAKKPAAKKTAAKKTTRKYSPAASESVRTEMDEMKAGKLRSGGSGKKVTNPKQAIAIGLSEARRAGKKVPPNPNRPSKKA